MEGPKIDLNELARQARESQSNTVEKTRDEKISDLRIKIAELEEKITAPSIAERFKTLSHEDQEAEIERIKSTLPNEEKYSLDEYLVEISTPPKWPNIHKARLQMAQSELDQLLAE